MKKYFLFIVLSCATWSMYGQCDSTKRPVVFIHGFLASGDTYARQILRFKERLYCPGRLFVFDWNSVTGDGKTNDSLLKSFIDNVLRITKAKQVDLIGHSAGGGLGRGFLLDPADAQKVAHYIHLGSRKWFYEYSWFPNKKCLNIYSSSDMVMGKMSGDVEGASNIDLKDKDHYEVATCLETFRAIYDFLNDNVQPDVYAIFESKSISGKAVLLGDNTPMAKATVRVHKLNSGNGARQSKEPFAVFQTDKKGSWGTFIADMRAYYELELIPADPSQRTISYFFEPFKDPNNNLYLRGFPRGDMIGKMLNDLPRKTDQSVIVIYSSNKAMIAGRDSVTVNGVPISSSMLTPAGRTIISSFVFDDGDGKTSGNALKRFSAVPFIGGVDIYLPANRKNGNIIYYNGRKLVLPARSSRERIMLAVFN